MFIERDGLKRMSRSRPVNHSFQFELAKDRAITGFRSLSESVEGLTNAIERWYDISIASNTDQGAEQGMPQNHQLFEQVLLDLVDTGSAANCICDDTLNLCDDLIEFLEAEVVCDDGDLLRENGN